MILSENQYAAFRVGIVLLRIVENDADSVAMAGAQLTDAMPEVDAIRAARPLYRTVMHSE